MPTLNRFPLLGLWAKEAARRLGYAEDEAESLGHAYAVLYAIRANRLAHPPATQEEKKKKAKPKPKTEVLVFGGDELPITHDESGRIRGLVGGDKPQTPPSYQASVKAKFPDDYYRRLEKCFRRAFKAYPPKALQGRLVYDLYDEWKKRSGKGRLVDLDQLLEWYEEKANES
jgi:hypothetical protein